MATQTSSFSSEAKVDVGIKKMKMNFQRIVRPGPAITYNHFAAGPRPTDFINFRNGSDVSSVNYQDWSSMKFQQSSSIDFQEASFINHQRQAFVNFQEPSFINFQEPSFINFQEPSFINFQEPSFIKSRKASAIKSRYPPGFKCEEVKKLQRLGESTQFTTWICIDLEAKNDLTTEVGVTWFQPLKDMYPRNRHFIIHGNEEYRSGQIRPKKKLPFEFGVSEVKTRQELAMCIMDLVSGFRLMGEVVLVGFALGNDLKWLSAMEADLSQLRTVDLQKIDAELRGVTIYNARRLGAVCAELGISADSPHNAGNDAMYTWQAAMGMLGRIRRDRDLMKMLDGSKAP